MASSLLTRSALSRVLLSRSVLRTASASRQLAFLGSNRAALSSTSRRSMSTIPTQNEAPKESKQPGETADQQRDNTANEGEFDENQVKRTILLKALNHVGKHGFTMDAIEHGSIDAGLSSSAKNMFENGEFDLIDFFYKKCNAEVNEYMENQLSSQKPIKTNEFVRSALIFRLKLLQPYIEHWPNAMAVQTFKPQNAIKSFNNLLTLCDDIWYHAGDKSTDMNWYSKRLILASFYKTTELYMLQDKSPEFAETIKFLDNRFQDLASFYKLNSEINNVKEGIKGSFTVLRNIMNLK